MVWEDGRREAPSYPIFDLNTPCKWRRHSGAFHFGFVKEIFADGPIL